MLFKAAQCWLRRAGRPLRRASRARASISAVLDGLPLRSVSAEGRLAQNTPVRTAAQTAAASARRRQRVGPLRDGIGASLREQVGLDLAISVAPPAPRGPQAAGRLPRSLLLARQRS